MILFCGDVHGEFKHVMSAVDKYRPKAIVLLGDIEASQLLERELEKVLSKTEVYFIHGNHDTDSVENYHNLFQSELADRNLHGRVVDIGGLKVGGLGGVFRGEIWYPDTPEAVVNYESFAEYLKQSEAGRILAAREAREKRNYPDAACLDRVNKGTPKDRKFNCTSQFISGHFRHPHPKPIPFSSSHP